MHVDKGDVVSERQNFGTSSPPCTATRQILKLIVLGYGDEWVLVLFYQAGELLSTSDILSFTTLPLISAVHLSS